MPGWPHKDLRATDAVKQLLMARSYTGDLISYYGNKYYRYYKNY